MESSPSVVATSITSARRAECFRALMEVLASAGGSMQKAEVQARLLERLGVTAYERMLVRDTERWWLDLQFQFTAYSKAKWLTRVRGTWSITPAGIEALRSQSAQQAFEAAQEAYRVWARTVRSHPADRSADDDEQEVRPIWLIGAGPAGIWAEQFQREQRIFVGFPEDEDGKALGSLAQVTKAQIRERMVALTSNPNPMNYVHCAWQFTNDMFDGDLVIVRKGNSRILGYGEVAGDYEYVERDGRMQHSRRVRWRQSADVQLPAGVIMATKTLTEISRYPGFADIMLGRRTEAALLSLGNNRKVSNEEVERYFASHPFVVASPTQAAAAARPPVQVVTVSDIAEVAFVEEPTLGQILDAIGRKKAVVLQGPPGTGKTWLARKLATLWAGHSDHVTTVQFHPAYQYEDFVRGLRPNAQGGFEVRDGVLVQLANEARANPGKNYVLLVDEINRANVAKVLGETLSLVEADKRKPEHAVQLGLSRDAEKFWLPGNLAIVATMNTADRSIALVDFALRRRFAFFTLTPAFAKPERFQRWLQQELCTDETEATIEQRRAQEQEVDALVHRIVKAMQVVNQRIAAGKHLGGGFVLGHSFFCALPDPVSHEKALSPHEWAGRVFREEITPMLREYAADDPKLLAHLLEPIEGVLAELSA
jgi:MoxR-like ATPase